MTPSPATHTPTATTRRCRVAQSSIRQPIGRDVPTWVAQRALPPVPTPPYRAAVPDDVPDLARELEERDELLLSCRELLLTIGTPQAAALVSHINALLDLDDGFLP